MSAPDDALLGYEHEVLTMLLAGDHEVLVTLRRQLNVARVALREFTGVGCFTTLRIAASAPRLGARDDFTLGDVHAELVDVEHGAGFVLFVRNGAIDVLEGFVYGDEQWPETPLLVRS